MSSFQRELHAAKAAVARAQAAVERLDRSALDARQKRKLTSIQRTLAKAEYAEYAPWPQDHPVCTVYESSRRALVDIEAIAHVLGAVQPALVADATHALHEAEDVLSQAYWRGDLAA
jgi:hypothetical protein